MWYKKYCKGIQTFVCKTLTACIQKIVPLHHRYNVGLDTERKDGVYLVQWEWLAWHICQ